MGAYLQRVDVVAIRKTASVKVFLLEKDVRSASSDIHATDCHRVIRGPSIGQMG